MKITKKDEIQSEALRTLLSESQTKKSKGSKGNAVSGSDFLGDDIQVDVASSKAIKAQFDPATFEAERTEKLERIKKQIQAGSYVMPSGEDLALKLAEEIGYEIAEGKNLKEKDE